MLRSDVPPPAFVDTADDGAWTECAHHLFALAVPGETCCSHFVRLWKNCVREDRVAQFIIDLHAIAGAPLGDALYGAIYFNKIRVADALATACPLSVAGDGIDIALWSSLCSATRHIPMQRMLIARHPDVVYTMLSGPDGCPLRLAVRAGVTFTVFFDLVTKLGLPLPPLIDAEWQDALAQNERKMDKTNADAIRRYIDPVEHRARVLAVAQGMHRRTGAASLLATLPDGILSNFIEPHMRADYHEHIRPVYCPDKKRRDFLYEIKKKPK